jgi:hypothetical protein
MLPMTIDDDGDFAVGLYPPWREALKLFLAAGFSPGALIPHQWFYEAFGLEMPHGKMLVEEADRLRLLYLAQFTAFRQALLTEHQIDLASKPGAGYEVIPAADQSALAWEEGRREVGAALRRMHQRIRCVDLAQLTSEQRQGNADDLARSAAMINAVRRARRGLTMREEATT